MEGLHPSHEGLGEAVQQDQLQPSEGAQKPLEIFDIFLHFSTISVIFGRSSALSFDGIGCNFALCASWETPSKRSDVKRILNLNGQEIFRED